MTLDSQLAARLEQVRALPSPPRVAMRILEAARNPDVSLTKVADVVTADPVITAKIMRTANSAIYARPGGCTTLRQALVLLGLDATLIIALSFSLVMSLRRDLTDGLDHERFWRRSLLAATAARALGRALGRRDGEALFLAALLQDIGMLALDRMDPQLYRDAGEQQREHRALSAFECQRIGNDHAAVGAWLMERWCLPEPVVAAIATSHEPMHERKDAFGRCVAMSGPLADVWLSSDWSYSFRELVGLAVASLELNHVQLGMVLDDLRAQIPETEAMFEKDLIDPGEQFVALEEARELLMTRGVEGFLRAASIEQEAARIEVDAPITLLRRHHRGELIEALARETDNALEDGRDATLMIAHIDGLEAVSQSQGAEAADRMLREAALVMLDNSGARVVGQYSDSELVLWLANTNIEAGEMAARRVRRSFEESVGELTGGTAIRLGLTLGIACLQAGEETDIETLLDQACKAVGARAASVTDGAELAQTS